MPWSSEDMACNGRLCCGWALCALSDGDPGYQIRDQAIRSHPKSERGAGTTDVPHIDSNVVAASTLNHQYVRNMQSTFIARGRRDIVCNCYYH